MSPVPTTPPATGTGAPIFAAAGANVSPAGIVTVSAPHR